MTEYSVLLLTQGSIISSNHFEEDPDELLRLSAVLGGEGGRRDVEEGGAAFRGHGLGQHGLAGAGWSDHKHAAPRTTNTLEMN